MPDGAGMIGDIIAVKPDFNDYHVYHGVLIRITEDNPMRTYVRGNVLPEYVETVRQRDSDYNTRGVYILREDIDRNISRTIMDIE